MGLALRYAAVACKLSLRCVTFRGQSRERADLFTCFLMHASFASQEFCSQWILADGITGRSRYIVSADKCTMCI